jgi:hypothetical protein
MSRRRQSTGLNNNKNLISTTRTRKKVKNRIFIKLNTNKVLNVFRFF